MAVVLGVIMVLKPSGAHRALFRVRFAHRKLLDVKAQEIEADLVFTGIRVCVIWVLLGFKVNPNLPAMFRAPPVALAQSPPYPGAARRSHRRIVPRWVSIALLEPMQEMPRDGLFQPMQSDVG